VKPLNKPIKVRLLEEAQIYFEELNDKIQTKFLKSFEKTQNGFKGNWFTKLESSDGIFEFRESDHQKFYRIFAFWDKEEEKETLVMGTHGLDKKSNKTPPKEIKKAEKIKKLYFEDKKNKL
jgi:phage-related protein